ncbi:DUF3631 domain-containing protein [Corynebacterium sanguinis]
MLVSACPPPRGQVPPLLKVARAAGGDWPDRAKHLILNDLDQQNDDREAGLTRVPRHVQLLRDIAAGWPTDTNGTPQSFTPTADLLRRIGWQAPDYWGSTADRGELTAQGLGRMLAHKFSIRSQRVTTGDRERGYYLTDFDQAFSSFGVKQPGANSSG